MEVRVPASPAPRPVAVSAKSSPVMNGAITPKTNLVALLLKHGADVNATNDGGETPLIKAVLFNDADSTAVLLKAGASPTIKDRSGHSAADYAEHSKSSLISSLMREASR